MPHKDKEANRKWHREYTRRKGREHLPTPTRECPERCELCGGPPGKKVLALDHCHVSGKFRGWICTKCNLWLGIFESMMDTFATQAADYLKRNT